MLELIREAGFGIYPVLLFGLAAVVVAMAQARAPRPGRVATAAWLMALTGVAGVLGVTTGMQASARYIHQVEDKWSFVVGLRESLNNIVAACALVAVAMMVLLFAHLRQMTRADAVASVSARDVAT